MVAEGTCTLSAPNVPLCLTTAIHVGFNGLPVYMGAVVHVGMGRGDTMEFPEETSCRQWPHQCVQLRCMAPPVMKGSCMPRWQVLPLHPEEFHMPIATQLHQPIWAEHSIQCEL